MKPVLTGLQRAPVWSAWATNDPEALGGERIVFVLRHDENGGIYTTGVFGKMLFDDADDLESKRECVGVSFPVATASRQDGKFLALVAFEEAQEIAADMAVGVDAVVLAAVRALAVKKPEAAVSAVESEIARTDYAKRLRGPKLGDELAQLADVIVTRRREAGELEIVHRVFFRFDKGERLRMLISYGGLPEGTRRATPASECRAIRRIHSEGKIAELKKALGISEQFERGWAAPGERWKSVEMKKALGVYEP